MKRNEINQIDHYSLSNVQISSNNISNYFFTTAQDLLVNRFSIEIFKDKKRRRIELTIGDKVCFVTKPSSDLVCCDTIVRGHLSKKFGGLESATVYVLVADNKLDFYKIVEKARCAEIAAGIALDVLKLESESICAVKQFRFSRCCFSSKEKC